MSINIGMPIGSTGSIWRWEVGLAVVGGLALGALVMIPLCRAYWQFAPLFFPEIGQYPNPKLGRRAFYRAMGNWQTTMLSISLWLIFVAAVFAWGISPFHVCIALWLLCAWSYVVVPLATRDIVRERLRRGLPEHDNSAPQVETGVQ